MSVTTRQYLALRLYYCEGWSYRRIGAAFGTTGASTYRLIQRGKTQMFKAAEEHGGNTLPIATALAAPSAAVASTGSRRNTGLLASRQDELLDALELHMERRAIDLADIEECMSSGSHLPTHTKGNPYDQWEMRYLSECAGEPLPTSAYVSARAAKSCAADEDTCTLTCKGCRRDSKARDSVPTSAYEAREAARSCAVVGKDKCDLGCVGCATNK